MKQWEIRQAIPDETAPMVVPNTSPRPGDVPHVLVEQLPIIVWTTDPVLEFTSSDGSELDELSLGPNQVVGITLFDLLETDDPRHPVISAHLLALGGQTVSFEMRLADRDFHGRVAPLLDGEGDQIGTICALIEDASVEPTVVRTTSTLVTVE